MKCNNCEHDAAAPSYNAALSWMDFIAAHHMRCTFRCKPAHMYSSCWVCMHCLKKSGSPVKACVNTELLFATSRVLHMVFGESKA